MLQRMQRISILLLWFVCSALTQSTACTCASDLQPACLAELYLLGVSDAMQCRTEQHALLTLSCMYISWPLQMNLTFCCSFHPLALRTCDR
jgi:hypothetical protein